MSSSANVLRVPRYVARGFDRARFRQLREKHGLVCAELGRIADVATVTINSYERGARNPQIDVLAKIMRALGEPMSAVIIVAPEERFPSYYRHMKGLTQPQLARKVVISTAHLRAVEAAQIRLSDSMVQKIAAGLDISEEEYTEAYERCRKRKIGEPY